ncbi:CLUMA_CG021301, isoform A [Clunio marinus]|uniref:CLUMA_CG021301, isoform A n=1 Tax=Clunio marinus TaxID=568069 RepID=A0A1J1J854_9DIPT|nr:CLUMA_CG021301, isoform A [Clunio marinus]
MSENLDQNHSELKRESSKLLKQLSNLSTISIKSEPSVVKVKKTPPRKLRSLVKKSIKPREADSTDSDDSKVEENKRGWKSWMLLAAVFLIGSYFISNISISSCGFWATYENNFNKIVHGDGKYCYRSIESEKIVEELKKNIVGQDDAISLIKASLNLANREKIIQMAFIGGTGVGKSLASNIIVSNWKWKHNTVNFIFDINFNADLQGKEAFDDDLRIVTSHLSDCGFNLIVIDDVDNESTTINRIAKLDRSLHRLAKQNLYKIVFIVIFNKNPNSIELEEALNNFVIIDFHPFTKELLEKCIEFHEKMYKVKLSPIEIDELKMINYTNFGCKTVAKKINLISNK